MEVVKIKEMNKITILKMSKDYISGHIFERNNPIKNVSSDILKYFSYFRLSSNKIKLPNEKNYQVFLDVNTNFKHYFLNNQEDFSMFFINNGVDDIHYLSNNHHNPLTKFKNFIINSKQIMINTSFKGLILGLELMLLMNPISVKGQEIEYQAKSLDSIQEMIYQSPYLSDEEKSFLFNNDFFEDYINYLNATNYTRYLNHHRFNTLHIDYYGTQDELYPTTLGYYYAALANVIHIRDNVDKDLFYDILSHEFIHLCQNDMNSYTVIDEAMAEILSYEYFNNSIINNYRIEVYLIRKLMEVIGPEPLIEYTFTNNFDLIKENVEPYLSTEDYQMFIECLTLHKENLDYYRSKLNIIINKLYEKKYHQSIFQDEIINHLYDRDLKRFYFNKRKMTKDNSYYTIPVYQTMDLQQAYKKNIIKIMTITEQNITVDEITKLNNNEQIDKDNYQILIMSLITKTNSSRVYPLDYDFSVYNDPQKYRLTLRIKKELTYEEYQNYAVPEGEWIEFEYQGNNDGYEIDEVKKEINIVTRKEKQYIPTILERFEDNKKQKN